MREAMREVPFAIIGAGPAGMAAAATAAETGVPVLLLDEQPRPGGQIYRAVDAMPAARRDRLGADYAQGLDLVRALDRPGIEHVPGATVWFVDGDGTVAWSVDGQAQAVRARRVLVATGAVERSVPIPGWTLPGVMTAGAAQILLKTAGVVPERAVIAGAGPLLYLIAQQLIRAGARPLALVETQPRTAPLGAARHLGGALKGWRYLMKGVAMLGDIRKAGVPRYTGARDLRVTGENRAGGRAEGLTFTSGGRARTIACDTVLLHHGVVPDTQIARALGLPHDWDEAQACFRPRTDRWGGTPLEPILIAGDGTGIGGAQVAALRGRLAALRVAEVLGHISFAEQDRQAAPLFRALAAELAPRPFLDALYPPPPALLAPPDETVVCRCEEVTAGDIRRYARLGCAGPNQTKAFGRSGMGPCQGRYCGLTVTTLLAETTGQTPDAVGAYRIRTPLKPVTVGELASLHPADTPVETVIYGG
jgi:NADPH-dependent 2,4-dienoyl-CoA reductase/sulfur reductase-like enzyme